MLIAVNKNSADIIKSLNAEEKRIFGIIQKRGPLSKSELLDISHLKLTTLNRVIKPLEDNELVIEAAIGESSGGRKPLLYDVNPKAYYLIGIDISRTYSKLIITNLKMDIIFENQFIMDEDCNPENTVMKICQLLYGALEELSIERKNVIGVGVGTVGPLDRNNGIIKNPMNFLSGQWLNVPIKQMLEDKLYLPIFIENGANTSVLGEFLFGDGKNLKSIAYFNCGIGIRTGAISSGTIIRSINDVEDAFAHMIIDVDGEKCDCGNYGCLECYCSIPSMIRKFTTEIKKGRNTLVDLPLEKITFQEICRAASLNDELAKEAITSAATIFGAGLANYINLLNPELVIMSGPIIMGSELFYDMCFQVALKKHYPKYDNRVIFSKGGHFGEKAIAIGAAAMALEKILGSSII